MLSVAVACCLLQAPRPNLVFIFSDDHARQAISAYGSKLMQTPAIDRLAKEGVRFDLHYTANPLCAPSRASLLTGKLSHINGHTDNRTKFDGNQETFPKLLQQAGYETAWIGKWHLESAPTGFSYWDILPGQGTYYNPDFINASGTNRETGYVTDIITTKAKNWLAKTAGKPFCLIVGQKAPHRPWQPNLDKLDLFANRKFPLPPDFYRDYSELNSGAGRATMRVNRDLRMDSDLLVDSPPGRLNAAQKALWQEKMKAQDADFHRRIESGESKDAVIYDRYIKDYLRCISSVDDSVRDITKTLENLGLAKNTIVIYGSDQGFFLGEFGWYDKRWFYEPSSGTPLIVRWPGVKPGVVKSVTSNIDLAPTILDALGVQPPADMQGVSLCDLIRTKRASKPVPFYGHFYESDDADHHVPKCVSLIDGNVKLMFYYELNEWELFDIGKDKGEHRNLWNDPRSRDLRRRMVRLMLESQRKYREDPALIERIAKIAEGL
ncbi:MAG: sulfatase [Armatimonadetes bacterium]|nr:sulfatase [Armatimonadota bacterium]